MAMLTEATVLSDVCPMPALSLRTHYLISGRVSHQQQGPAQLDILHRLKLTVFDRFIKHSISGGCDPRVTRNLPSGLDEVACCGGKV